MCRVAISTGMSTITTTNTITLMTMMMSMTRYSIGMKNARIPHYLFIKLQSHSHKFSADHKHLHQKKLVVNKGWKRHNNEIAQGNVGGSKDSMKHPSHVETYKNKNKNSLTKDYHIKSVENYIGDSGKEFEGAAEQIVESYMGEYMQVRLCKVSSQNNTVFTKINMFNSGAVNRGLTMIISRNTCRDGTPSIARRRVSSVIR